MCVYVIYTYIQYCLFFFVSSIKIDWYEAWEECSAPPQHPVKSFVSIFFISEWCKNQSIVFGKKKKKAIFLGKQGRLKNYVCSKKIDFTTNLFYTFKVGIYVGLIYSKMNLSHLGAYGPLLDLWIFKAQSVIFYIQKITWVMATFFLLPSPSPHTFQG